MEPPTWYAWLVGDAFNWNAFNLPPVPGEYRPQLADLVSVVPCALALLLLRFGFERLLMRPVGRKFGLSERRVSPPAAFGRMQESLEPHYRRAKRPDQQQLRELSKKFGYSEKSIVNWFSVRRNKDKPSKLDRFTESTWYILYYTSALAYGLYVVWDEEYTWNSEHLWIGWPRHHVPPGLYWYYILQLGFYLSSLATLAFDVRRKDFSEMATHHVVTVILILLSWALNFLRIGTLTLLLHDVVDPLLNFGKLGQYISKPAVSDGFFVVFLIMWVITRLVLLPYKVVYSVYADSLRVLEVPVNPVYCIFLAGFCALQMLHFVWTWYILRILMRILRHGQNAADVRSDSEIEDKGEEEEEEEEEEVEVKKAK